MADIFDFPRDARNVARADGKGADMGGEAPQTMLMRRLGKFCPMAQTTEESSRRNLLASPINDSA